MLEILSEVLTFPTWGPTKPKSIINNVVCWSGQKLNQYFQEDILMWEKLVEQVGRIKIFKGMKAFL